MADTTLQESDLRWIGFGEQKVGFTFESDLDLLPSHDTSTIQGEDKRTDIFSDPKARYDFSSLLQSTRKNASDLSNELWKLAWQGFISNDSFGALRKGITTKFKLPDPAVESRQSSARSRRSGQRARFARWKGSLPYTGSWFLLPKPELPEDALEMEELNKDRVRLLLDRYGILFRELLLRESPSFQWRYLFRSLRLMELAGEILSGYFFEDIPGPQFISHSAFRFLQKNLPDECIFWLNAADPVSCCGIQVDALKHRFPPRLPSTHIVYRGSDIVLIVKRNGKDLEIYFSETDSQLPEILQIFNHLLYREFKPLKRIVIENINDQPAVKSPFARHIKDLFETVTDHKQITIYRKSK